MPDAARPATLDSRPDPAGVPIATATLPPPPDRPPPAPARPRTVIEPPRRWQLVDWRELWRYRELLQALVARDVKVRYKQTALGVAWAVLQPAMQMAVFTVFFGRLAHVNTGDTDRVPQPLFFLCGVLPWMFFSGAVNSAANSVLGSANLVTKVYFPRLAVPFAAVAAAGVDLCVGSALLLAVMLYYGVTPGVGLLALPLVVGLLAVLAAGVGTGLSALTVVYRDVRYVVPFFVQLGMFATPTIYLQPTGNEGRLITTLLTVNPLTSLVGGFRAAVIGGPVPWDGLAVAAAVAAAAFAAGCLYFRSQEDKFADII